MANKYLLSLGTGTTYTLKGDNAEKFFSPASDQVMDAYLTSGKFGGLIALKGLAKIKITGARLTNASLEITGNTTVAAQMKLRLSKIVEGSESGDPFAEFDLNIGKWNRWEKKNIVIEPDSHTDTTMNRPCQFVIDDSSVFFIYDFNIQDNLVDTAVVRPVLELEIEADAILDASTGLAI